MNSNRAAPAVLVVAGEASADLHGAKVMECLRAKVPSVECFGLGGERLKASGLEVVAESEALNVVGVSEALRGLGRVSRIFTRVLQVTRCRRPRAALLLDLPDFNLRLAKRLKRMGVPVVYYLAPQAWAWRQGRVRQLRRWVDKLCVVFPFEEQFFKSFRIPAEFVGHPLTEVFIPPREPSKDRVAILPGSRPKEIERLLPPLAGAARILKAKLPTLKFELPLAPGVDRPRILELVDRAGVEVELVPGGAGAALSGARLCLAASGTATLEAALASVPMVVVYRVSRLTYAMVRPIFRLPFFCIVNILAGRLLVPELLQGQVRPGIIARKARMLLGDGPERERMIAGLRQVASSLGTGRPSERVAGILARLLLGEVP